MGARRSAFPVVKPHTAMQGAFALCDSPHVVNERLPLHTDLVPPQPNGAMAMTNSEHEITLTDAELNEVVGGLNPQPLPPRPRRS